MSEKNGDKARFGRLRKQKIARRQATRDLRSRLLQAQQAKPASQGPKAPPTTAPAKSVARPAAERTGKTQGGTGASAGSTQKKQK